MRLKQPHEMTWREFRQQGIGNPFFLRKYPQDKAAEYLLDTLHLHRRHLVTAVMHGKVVESRLLREHYLIE